MPSGGELLAALADVGAYTEEDAQSCFLRLLRVLKFIHSRGIIHRDLKLENLVMSQDGARVDSIKLIDFGMAKYAAEPEKEQTVIGTPLYVSPEILVAASKDGNCKNPYSYAVSLNTDFTLGYASSFFLSLFWHYALPIWLLTFNAELAICFNPAPASP